MKKKDSGKKSACQWLDPRTWGVLDEGPQLHATGGSFFNCGLGTICPVQSAEMGVKITSSCKVRSTEMKIVSILRAYELKFEPNLGWQF